MSSAPEAVMWGSTWGSGDRPWPQLCGACKSATLSGPLPGGKVWPTSMPCKSNRASLAPGWMPQQREASLCPSSSTFHHPEGKYQKGIGPRRDVCCPHTQQPGMRFWAPSPAALPQERILPRTMNCGPRGRRFSPSPPVKTQLMTSF